ncbi:hypothetical protein AB1K70_03325 [Bremerella sp. JC770]|uniref:hypothetical protein n=1 Tax=Bremerella sp. JC770 TaxID=3232137 RepID=UPI003458B864
MKRRLRIFLLPAVFCLFILPFANVNAQGLDALAIDLAYFSVKTFHPNAKFSEMATANVATQVHGDEVKAQVTVSFVERLHGVSNQSLATVQATFVLTPSRKLLNNVNYSDNTRSYVHNLDQSAKVVTDYNIRLDQLTFLPESGMVPPLADQPDKNYLTLGWHKKFTSKFRPPSAMNFLQFHGTTASCKEQVPTSQAIRVRITDARTSAERGD